MAEELSNWILRGPAKSLPAPLCGLPTTVPKEKDKAELIGYEIDFGAKIFAATQTSTIVHRVFNQSDGQMHGFMTKPGSPNRIQMRLGINDKQSVLGLTESSSFEMLPPKSPFFWEEPNCFRIHVFPIAGDKENIKWQVGVEFADPLQNFSEAALLLRRRAPAQKQYRPPTNELSATTLRPGDADVSEINLKKSLWTPTPHNIYQ